MMSRYNNFLLRNGVVVMVFLGCAALDSGIFHSCPQVSCNGSISINPCLVENNVCQCQTSNSSVCGTLDQQAFVNLTGASNEIASKWTCCVCPPNTTYCCDKCPNISTSSVVAPLVLAQPTWNFTLLLVFVLECEMFKSFQDNLTNSLQTRISSLTSIPLSQITVINMSCASGQRPYCGVDVASIRAHHRERRLAVGGRMKGSKKKKNEKQFNYHNTNRYYAIEEDCDSLTANITIYERNKTALESSLKFLRQLQVNNSVIIPLWDGRTIFSTFMLSAMYGASYSLHEAPRPLPLPLPPTDGVPPIETDLKPMIYAGASILGLVALCVLWQFIKQSWLLSRKKFTPINSDRLDHKTDQQLKQLKIKEAMEENDRVTANGSASSSLTLPRSNVEAKKQWPPGYPVRSLKPAYEPTELHYQRTPPRLILDDEGCDIEDRRSIGSASMSNLDNDTLSDILNSDDEQFICPSNSCPPCSPGYTNPAFIEDEKTTGNSYPGLNRKPGIASKSLTRDKGNAKLSVNPTDVHNQRDGSIASSELSLDAGEDTVFLPAKDKKQEKQKKVNKFLSPSNGEKIIRRSSITSVVEDEGIRKNSARGAKSPNKSRIEHLVEEKSRKPSLASSDKERRPGTPKDTNSKGKKTTTASTLASPRHSPRAEDIGVRNSESSGKNKIKGSVLSVTTTTKKRNSVSVAAITGAKEDSEGSVTKFRVRSTTSINGERRKSAAEPARFGESLPEGSRTKANELTIEDVIEDKNTAATGNKKKKMKKKEKAEKEVKIKVADSDDSSEEKTAKFIPDTEAGLTVISLSEEHKSKFVASQESETKAKKKKKRKEKEEKKRKIENPEPSSDEEAQGNTQDSSSDIIAVKAKTQKTPAVHDGTQDKKKKKKEVATGRKNPETAEERPATVRRNGSFVRSTNNFKGNSPNTATPERRPMKSICIEDMESRSPPIGVGGSRRKTDIPDIPEDWEQTSSSQINTRSRPNSISPIPTGYKSPRLVIKPSYHKY